MASIPVLMQKFGRVLDLLGVDIVMSKLDELEQSAPNNYYKEIESFITTEVCSRYKTTKSNLLKSRVDDDDFLARNMCFILIKKYMPERSNAKIAKLFGKGPQSVSDAEKQFSEMNTKIKHEREFIQNYSELDKRIKNFTQTLNNTNDAN